MESAAFTEDPSEMTEQSNVTVHTGVTTGLGERLIQVSGEGAGLKGCEEQSKGNAKTHQTNRPVDSDSCAVFHHESPNDFTGACERVYSENVNNTVCCVRSTSESPNHETDMEYSCPLQPLNCQPKTHGWAVRDVPHADHKRQSEKLPLIDTVYLALCARLHGKFSLPPVQNDAITHSKTYLQPKHTHIPVERIQNLVLSSSSKELFDDKDGYFSITIGGINSEHHTLCELPSPPQKNYSESLKGSPSEQTNEVLSNFSYDSRDVTTTGVRNLNSCTNSNKGVETEPDTSHNVKLIQWFAHKYNEKENASIRRKKKKRINQTKESYNLVSLDQAQTIVSKESSKPNYDKTSSPIEVHPNEIINKCAEENKKLQTDTCLSLKVPRRRRGRNRHAGTKCMSATLNSSGSRNTVVVKARRGVIMKMLRDFRRSNHWRSHNNRIQRRSERSNLSLVISTKQETISSVYNNHPIQREETGQLLNVLNDQLTTKHPTAERTESLVVVTEPKDTSAAATGTSTIKVTSVKSSEPVTGSDRNDSDKIPELPEPSPNRTFNSDTIPNTEVPEIMSITSANKPLQNYCTIIPSPCQENGFTEHIHMVESGEGKDKQTEFERHMYIEPTESTPISPSVTLRPNSCASTESRSQGNCATLNLNKMAENGQGLDVQSAMSIQLGTELMESVYIDPGRELFPIDCFSTFSQCQEHGHTVHQNKIEGKMLGENVLAELSMQIGTEPSESTPLNLGETLLPNDCDSPPSPCQDNGYTANPNKMMDNKHGKIIKGSDDAKQETSMQIDTERLESIEEASGPNKATSDTEVVSLPDVSEYPLEAAIDILCGSEAENAIMQCNESAERPLLQVTGEKRGMTEKEVKLICRLREFLTQFESTVQKEEETKHFDQASENNDGDVLHMSEAPTEMDDTQQQSSQPVKFLVLDRVELPNLKENTQRKYTQNYTKQLHNQFPNTHDLPNNYFKTTGTYEPNVSNLENPPEMDSENSKIPDKQKEKTKTGMADIVSCTSPDSTSVLEVSKVPTKRTAALPNQDVNNSEMSTSVPDSYWTLKEQQNELNPLTEWQHNVTRNLPYFDNSNVRIPQTKLRRPVGIHSSARPNIHSVTRKSYMVTDISKILKQGDNAASLFQLSSLRNTCKIMLQHFISNFEIKQVVQASKVAVTRDLILERYLEHPPLQTELKYEAIDAFLELQMMLESWQFVDNKMRLLSGQSTFRSLLWYDATLYGELFKGRVGFQQQSSLYTSFQTSLTHEGPYALQRYHKAVSSFCQKLLAAPDASYYMYLKSKREKLELEAALRNPDDIGSFYFSVPLSCMLNTGDSLESLQRTQSMVTTFTETPADQLEGGFDVGKAEHLSLMCRFLQEKMSYLNSSRNCELGKISWFGMEHLFYDASKVLLLRDTSRMRSASHEVLSNYRNENARIIYGKKDSEISLLHKRLSAKNHQMLAKASLPRQQQTGSDTNHKIQGRGRPRTKNKTPEQVIDLTGETSPGRPVDDQPRECHMARLPNHPVTFYQCVSQPRANLSSNQVIRHQSHDDPQQSHVIPQQFVSCAVPHFPEIRTCILTKNLATEKAQTHFQPGSKPAALLQWPSPWLLHNKTQHSHSSWSTLPNWPPAISEDSHVPVFSPMQTPSSPWSPAVHSFLQPAATTSSPLAPLPVNPAEQPCRSRPLPIPSTTNHDLPPLASHPIDYPYFLLNGQTYSTTNTILSKGTPHNRRRFHPYPT